ncbi:MAG: hypothetical protein Ct9H300mP18_13890 [Candidatus Neomarinimicrobiota bacterium]|nr:MAG: hypothetical protein Ct9H300mP18_13890 [Candidatus Neomarinimicrobiota bacterium]
MESDIKIGIEGSFNLLLLLGVIVSVLLSGFWKPHIEFEVFYVHVEFRMLSGYFLLCLTFASWKLNSSKIREANEYTWFPIVEGSKIICGKFFLRLYQLLLF